MKDTDLKAIFKKVVVDEITKKQEGLTRFINQMRYQITKAEEKWANLYYDFLRGIFKIISFEIIIRVIRGPNDLFIPFELRAHIFRVVVEFATYYHEYHEK